MKLKTKLIPLVSFATVCTAVVPITVSCGKSSSVPAGYVSLLKKQIPTVEQYSHTTVGNKGANALYTKAITDNIDIFVQDYYWFLSLKISAIQDGINDAQKSGHHEEATLPNDDYERILNDAVEIGANTAVPAHHSHETMTFNMKDLLSDFMGKALYHNIKLSNVSIAPYEEETNAYIIPVAFLASFTIDYEYEYDYTMIDQSDASQTLETEKIRGSATFTNVPYFISNEQINETGSLWCIRPCDTYLEEHDLYNKKWSISLTDYVESNYTLNDSSFGGGAWTEKHTLRRYFDQAFDFNQWSDNDVMERFEKSVLLAYGTTFSYYMWKIAYDPLLDVE